MQLTNLSSGNGLLNALLHGTEPSATPAHLLQQLVTFVVLVEALVLLCAAICRATVQRQ